VDELSRVEMVWWPTRGEARLAYRARAPDARIHRAPRPTPKHEIKHEVIEPPTIANIIRFLGGVIL
jgi:hypothetical protein